eukprot:CAMPEP_0206452186 /NCGR_PEP_ID=MMETSP0324_2-20121206/19801_1 /ASSEMBLY_ACC=CAM_ASM_000836 /TAXON_ID=2866 /ORGANISM="Crypthecodinium cohnii, Strain Seligo" /LENGTH=371 /DNA_ID=CAMNT_0053922239 /DNA_START=18 /DNA_END=1133 /DNA_ORIENTATION=-
MELGSDDGIIALGSSTATTGSVLSDSKVRYSWALSIDGRRYTVDFTNSKTSGMKRVFVDGRQIHEQKVFRSPNFNYSWPIGQHLLSIAPREERRPSGLMAEMTQKVDCTFDLNINGIPFQVFERQQMRGSRPHRQQQQQPQQQPHQHHHHQHQHQQSQQQQPLSARRSEAQAQPPSLSRQHSARSVDSRGRSQQDEGGSKSSRSMRRSSSKGKDLLPSPPQDFGGFGGFGGSFPSPNTGAAATAAGVASSATAGTLPPSSFSSSSLPTPQPTSASAFSPGWPDLQPGFNSPWGGPPASAPAAAPADPWSTSVPPPSPQPLPPKPGPNWSVPAQGHPTNATQAVRLAREAVLQQLRCGPTLQVASPLVAGVQ